MQLATFLKNVRRQARIEARGARLQTLKARAEGAGDTARVAELDKEGARRAAEHNFLSLRNDADLEDHPEWQSAHDAMRTAVLSGSRGSSEAKAIMGAALAAGAGAAPAAEEAATAE
jgi:hypothetical protein